MGSGSGSGVGSENYRDGLGRRVEWVVDGIEKGIVLEKGGHSLLGGQETQRGGWSMIEKFNLQEHARKSRVQTLAYYTYFFSE